MSILTFPRLSDLYGRKKIFYFGLIAYVCVVTFIVIFTNQYLYYCMIFLIGFGGAARMQCGYLYLSEMLPKRWGSIVTSIGLVFVSESVAMGSVYFWFISKYWRPFEIFGIGLAVLTISSVFWMPESPRFYLGQKRYDEAMDSFKNIAKINGVKFNEIMLVLDKKTENKLE